jgi:hypothetical protein
LGSLAGSVADASGLRPTAGLRRPQGSLFRCAVSFSFSVRLEIVAVLTF